jgi:hypothetical protein
MAATCSTSGVAGISEPSLTDIMGVLMTIQNEQNTQKLNMKNIESNVLCHKCFYVYLEGRSPFQHSRQFLVEIQHRCYYHRHRRKIHQNVDKKVNDELADMIHVIFREGISDEK